MIAKIGFLFMCCLLVFTESAFVDSLSKKCSINDWECQREVIQTVITNNAKTGIPEFNIPPMDPFQITNVTIKVLEQVSITMLDGVAKGVKGCVINKIETEVDNEHAAMELTCDLTIKGKYKATADSPLLQGILGGSSVHADGNVKVVIKKMHMRFDYHFEIRKRDDGEIYIEGQRKNLKYNSDIGKITFAATGIYLGETDTTDLVVNLLNDQWKLVMQNYGKPFLDTAMEIIYENVHKFFKYTPTKYYLTDDLTSYIKKD